MKVIKYGKGYEPKQVVCECCKSEIEYEKNEVDAFSYYYRGDKNSILLGSIDDISFQKGDIQVYRASIECPVCQHRIIIDEREIPIDMKVTIRY